MKKIEMAVAMLLVIQLAGCLGVYKLEKPMVHYQLSPAAESVRCDVKKDYVLKVMPVLVTLPYGGTRLIYSSDDYKVEPSVHYRWITAPDEMIRDYLVKSLGSLSVFGDVIKREGALKPDYLLETQVSRMDCVKTDSGHVAHLAAKIVLIKQPSKSSEKPKICLKKSYNILEEIPGNESSPDVESVVKALNNALKKFSEELQKDLCNYFM